MVLFLSALLIIGVSCSPSTAKDYSKNAKVTLYVNKVGPHANPHETYHYYQLPVCRPENIIHKSLSLSEVLDGDRMAESLYIINFGENREKDEICKPVEVKSEEYLELLEAIEENYYFEFVIDELPVRGFLGRLEEEGIFPHNHKVYIYTHHHFVLEYNGKNVISAKVDIKQVPPVRLDNRQPPFTLTFTYSVEWVETSVKYDNRDIVSGSKAFFPTSLEIHWLSVINSTLLVFLLMGFVVLILVRVVRNDLIRYNEQDLGEKEDHMDNGWKVIHADVFRFPKFVSLFCSILGVGCQLLSIVSIILLVASLQLLNVHRHGFINSVACVLYALTSCIAGFTSSAMYKQFRGTQWVMNINLTSCLFSVPVFLVWCISNSFFWGYNTTQALPFTTVMLLLVVWLLIGYPLCVLGGILGKNIGSKYSAPCRTRTIPRELPNLPFYQGTFFHCIVGGFLPFSAISVELYYIFTTIWGRETYTLYGILSIVFIILLSVTACVAVALTYFQLASEDYRWWWRSIALFVFGYSLFFYYKRSQLNGVLQTVQYFSYVVLICYAFFLALGTVAFFASHQFVKYIYTNVKTD